MEFAPAEAVADVDDDLAFLDFGDEPEPTATLAAAADPTEPPLLVATVTEEPFPVVPAPAGGAVELPGEVTATAEAATPQTDVAEVTVDPLPPATPVEEPQADSSPVPAAAAVVASTAAVAAAAVSAAATASAGMSGPSLFGFNFEGGSFLGGMPLQLNNPGRGMPPGGITFDNPTQTAPPVVPAPVPAAPPPAAAEPVVEPAAEPVVEAPRVRPASPPAVGEPLGLTGMVHGTDAPPDAPALPVPPPPSVLPPPVPPIGLVPPPPVAPVGLVGGSGRTAPTPRPAAAAAAAPPVSLAGPNGRPRTAEVFSQMAGPIGVEAFATRPRSADQYHIPDVDRSNPGTGNGAGSSAAARPDAVPPPSGSAGYQAAVEAQIISGNLRRRRKVKQLATALAVLPVLWVAGVYTWVTKEVVVVGSLHYDGLKRQGESDRRHFYGNQVFQLCGEDVRQSARAALKAAGEPTGLTEDSVALDLAVRNQASFQPKNDDSLQFTYHATDRDGGAAQVRALLMALRDKDESLTDVRARAQHELDVAQRAADDARAADDLVKKQRREQTAIAQDRPDKATLDALDKAADDAARHVTSVADERRSVQAELDTQRKRDPTKPINADTDPEMVARRHALEPIESQIKKAIELAKLGAGAAGGPSTEPADDNPLLTMLQQQRGHQQAGLDRRQAELIADGAKSVEQRVRDRDAAIASLGLKLDGLVQATGDATAAAKAATEAAAAAHAKDDVARAAYGRSNDLIGQQNDADQALQAASADLSDKQHAVDASVTVAATPDLNPVVAVVSDSDPRPVAAIVGAVVIGLALGVWLLATAGSGGDAGEDDEDGAERVAEVPVEPAEMQPVEV